MKLTTFLLFLTLIQIQASTYSQNTKISLDIQNKSVEHVLDAIESLSEFKFFVDTKQVDLNRIVTVKEKKERISSILKKMFENTNVTWEVLDKQIILNTITEKPKENIPVPDEEEPEIEQIIITGNVTDSEGMPLPGVNILIEDTIIGADTDFDGNFTIEAAKGQVLIFSYLGMKTQRVIIGEETIINVVLQFDANALEEVVVTALGIKKEKKRVGYAVQEVAGESVQKAIAPNVVESLTGKVAGLIVTNSNEFFSDAGIFLRGEKPLIVVDGIPVDTNMWNINSDDIESFSVLKAAAAAALYGAAGRDGAIQITLKSGVNGAKGTTVSVNSSTTFQSGFIRIPRAQTQYGPGSGGIYEYVDGKGGGKNDSDYVVWGPKFDGRLLPQFDSPIDPVTGERIPTPWVSRGPDNLGNFMETGIVNSNNVTVQTVGEKGSFTISDTYRYSKASVPGAKLDINTLRLRGLLNISDKLSLDGSLQFNYQFASNVPRSNYGPHSPLYNMTIWGGAHFDIRNFKDYWVEGKENVQQRFVEHWRYNNPYMVAHEFRKPYRKNDIIAFLKFNYKINDKVNLFVRSHLNTYDTTWEEKISKDIYDYSIPDRGGRYRRNEYMSVTSNTDFMLNYEDVFLDGDFDLKASLGGNQKYTQYESFSAATTQLVVPGVFKLSNSVDKVTPTSYREQKGVYSLYAYTDLGFKDYLFMNVSGRIDQSSTLPAKNNSFFYPSASLSGIISNMVELPKAISYLKVRGAYAKVGGDLAIYSATNSYSTGGRRRNLPTASYPDRLENPDIEPSFNSSIETGIEAKFFNSRVGFEVSYFENTYGPGIYSQRYSQAAGYTSILKNGRKTQKKGFDLTVFGKIFDKEDFSWNTAVNFDTWKETLLELPPFDNGEPQLQEGRTMIGDRLGDYWWYDFDYAPDGQLIMVDGVPKSTDMYVNHGNTLPDFAVSLNNDIRYKNFSLSFLIDGRFGGITYDRYKRDLWRSGSHPDAIHPEREFSNVAYVSGGDARTMMIPGVKIVSGEATYDPDGNILTDTREFAANDVKIDYQRWAQNYKGDWRNVIIEKTFAKLREVTLTYEVPEKLLSKTLFNQASISFVGRNLFYWTKNDTFGDMDTYSMSTGDTNLQMPSQRTYGVNVNLKF